MSAMTGRGRKEHGAVQRARAIAMREGGATFRQIGDAMGISRQAAAKHVAKALDELRARTTESAERVRQLELLRLDALLRANWAKRGEVEHAKVLLSISARRAKLEGLDAPQRTELTGAGGKPLNPQPPEPELPNLENLTDAQLDQLQELLRLAGVEAPRASEVGLEPARPALPPRAALLQVEVPRAVPVEAPRALRPPVVEDSAK